MQGTKLRPRKGNFRCLMSGDAHPATYEHIRAEGQAGAWVRA